MPGRLLAVHAHPDDESITMGGTMSVLAERGVQVANVCCTDGELATIVAADMPEEEYRPRLGEVRRAELQRACAILGVAERLVADRLDALDAMDTRARAWVPKPPEREKVNFWFPAGYLLVLIALAWVGRRVMPRNDEFVRPHSACLAGARRNCGNVLSSFSFSKTTSTRRPTFASV